MSIKVSQISKYYGEQKALNELSFEIGKAEIVGFLGPNGAGKSTMMKILTCFLPQSSGEAFVCGLNVEKESLKVRSKIGYLPENNPLYYDMYVEEFLEFVGGIYKIKHVKSRIQELVEMVGLVPEKHKKIGSLSKGYKQRVGLAQAIIHDPEVLILDEATTGLDPNQIIEIRQLIKDLGKNKTVLLSTHIMQEVEALCDRVLIINKGELVADQKAENIKSLKKDREIILVEFEKQVDKKDLMQMDGLADAVLEGSGKWRISSEKGKDIRAEIFRFGVEKDNPVISLSKEEDTLEDIFKTLTAEK